VSIGGFGMGHYAANQILSQTLVAMGMKFGTKWAITRHMYEMSLRFLHLARGFEDGANKQF